MARAVAEAIDDRAALVAEAGTGVGKTYAYLVPLLLSGGRSLVSTATKNLQDQLHVRDIPQLKARLRLPARVALLKGRASYLCLHRTEQARSGALLQDRESVRMLAVVERWAQATRSGDLSEVQGLDERSSLIPIVTSTRDNCLGGDCPRHRECHLMRARREALAADLVVVNHHLFFADLALRDSGVAELLPAVDAVVFDEAHQLIDTGLQFLGNQLATGVLADFGRDLRSAGLLHARGLAPWIEWHDAVERAARELRLAAAGDKRDLRGIVKLRWQERDGNPAFRAALGAVEDALESILTGLQPLRGVAPDLDRLAERGARIAADASRFGGECDPERVRWIDAGPREARLVESPLHVRELFAQQRAGSDKAWIFTSATLGDDDESSWFSSATALEDARHLRLGSPFDYPRNARLWVTRGLVRPADPGHPRAVGALAARLARRIGGRTFVLTTSLRVLESIAAAIDEAGTGLELLVQGRETRRALLARFARGGCILVGSASFWEGVDMPGDALQCVVIDKLPFPPPTDPLIQARAREVEAAGGNAFESVHLGEAAVALKQGAGRLIRGESDRGLLVIADCRMAQMAYGRRLRRALPPMTAIETEAEACAWLDELAAAGRD